MVRGEIVTSITAVSRPSKEKKKGVRTQAAAAKAGQLSRTQRRKERKRSKASLFSQWCWYCDKTYLDAKVLLQHQKAKHFRCPHCPRRLNTAGGLAVHIDQVHKLPVDRLENTLPGRDSFDIEIYGMEGIPKDDLAEWKRARETELGLVNEKPKRAKYFKGVVPMEEMAKQLAIHRQLMRNSAAGGVGLRPPGALPLTLPGGIPLPPGFPLPPGLLPPPGFASPAPGLPIPGISPGPAAPYVIPTSRTEMKGGGVLVYGDNDESVEEKRAKNPKYARQIVPTPTPSQIPAPMTMPMSGFPLAQAMPPSQITPAPAAAAAFAPLQQPIPPQTYDAATLEPIAGQKRARAADFI